jgi:hypothetical protein
MLEAALVWAHSSTSTWTIVVTAASPSTVDAIMEATGALESPPRHKDEHVEGAARSRSEVEVAVEAMAAGLGSK